MAHTGDTQDTSIIKLSLSWISPQQGGLHRRDPSYHLSACLGLCLDMLPQPEVHTTSYGYHAAQIPKTITANQDMGKHGQTANETPTTWRYAQIRIFPAQDQRPDTRHTSTLPFQDAAVIHEAR